MPTEFGGLLGEALRVVPECEPWEEDYCGANSTLHVCSRHAAIVRFGEDKFEEGRSFEAEAQK